MLSTCSQIALDKEEDSLSNLGPFILSVSKQSKDFDMKAYITDPSYRRIVSKSYILEKVEDSFRFMKDGKCLFIHLY